ncbi:pyridoxal-phosphate-dependent aminotransferase family protein [Heyndrickxia acidicola]|uniref:Alanine--glyoxylate aminotransferase family protein n=1 Tax=Heyndrickxia acidicola TaxID=209389 RepID=A0ABU6MDT0_9BACI|nr:alanine--glyoxylate aminotransferase family protein [Heyndrickxia acidicola]MED1202826.1 alanine--glyoxylate aminotransferase family protein [Heyndrickxia acidicola]
MLMDRQYLFTPGPTPIPERVKTAMNQSMIAHRSESFSLLLESVSKRLSPIFGSENPVITLSGSGTLALECAVVNTVQEHDDVVVIETGAFGERFSSICESYGARVHKLQIEWGTACQPEKLEQFLQTVNGKIKAVFATYCETSTAVINPIKELGEVISRHTDALFIVDGVSCIGAVPADMKDWHIDILVSGSQKAFMLPPGLAFIALNNRAREAAKNCKTRRFYLDLNRYLASYDTQKTTPFTPPVSLLFGAEEVCSMIEEEGMDQVIQRHLLMKNMVRKGLKALSLPLFVSDAHASPTVTSFKPEQDIVNQIKKQLKEEQSIIIAGGQKKLKGHILRIGHMGYCTPDDILKVLSGLEMVISQIRNENLFGKATSKAKEEWFQHV